VLEATGCLQVFVECMLKRGTVMVNVMIRSSSMRCGWNAWLFGLLLAVMAPMAVAAQYALLVGVSNYPSLSKNLQLVGPQNDVDLIRSLLLGRGYAAQNVRVLADGVRGAHGEPTRAAILNEMKALATRAGRGDFVFLFFAGHGSQQPARNLGPNNPEPDGLDEIFLPRDIGKWDDKVGQVHNAITDDEIGALITAIRNRGAFVWAAFDTCHSGTITRGIDDDGVRYRDARPSDLGIPGAALQQAAQAAAATVPRSRSAGAAAPMTALQGVQPAAGVGGFVAFYAAQSWERAPEQPLPAHLSAGDPNKRSHGVFTYSLAEVLAMNPTMTYRQAGEQILHRYREHVRGQPTPLFEGSALDAPVFGTAVRPQVLQWKLEKAADGLRVPAGTLHRLAEGAVFSVVANPADADKAVIGYLRATKVELLGATVVPVAHGGKPLLDVAKLPAEAYARLVHANTSLALRVSLPAPVKGQGEAAAQAVLGRLAKEKVEGLAVTWLPASQAGEVRLALRNGHLWFLSPSGELIQKDDPAKGEHKTISIDLAGKNEQQVRDLVVETLRAMARAASLLKLSAMAGSTAAAQGVEIRMSYERGGKPFDLSPSRVADLRHGDKLHMSIQNTLNRPVDVNLLFIDSRFGIRHLVAERFEARAQRTLEIGAVDTATTLGREGVLAIVTEAEPGMAQADFRFLSQPTLLATRSATARGAGSEMLDLLEAAGFAPERTRGLAQPARTLSTTSFRLYNWNTTR